MRLISANSPASIAAHLLLRQVLWGGLKLIGIGAAGFALLWGGQGREARAEIVLTFRDGSAFVNGFLSGTLGGQIQESKQYNVEDLPPAGLASFALQASPPAGTTTIQGASATSDARVNATIMLDTLADTLFLSSGGSSSAAVSADQSTRQNAAEANARTNFSQFFTIDQSYDYEITSTLSAGANALPNENADAESMIVLQHRPLGGGLRTNVFVRDRFFPTPFRRESSVGPDVGSLTGTLDAGTYTLAAQTLAGLNNFEGSSASANYQYTLRLTSLVRWEDPVSGDFQTAGNWIGGPPSGSDHAVIDRPGTYTITLAGNAAHKRLDVGGNGANVTLDLDGHRYRLDELRLGDPSGNFSFSLSDSSGIVAVPPRDSGPWPAPGTGEGEITNLMTDGSGRTEITAQTESQIGLIDHSHVVTVQGDGDWQVNRLTVGDQRPATLLVSGGGKVNSTFPVVGKRVRGILSGPGKVVVSGGGGLVSTFSAGEMIVGDDGKGELEIKAGGEVSARDFRVGNASNGLGVVTVDGATASLRQTDSSLGDLIIGSEGKGTLNVQNDGRVDSEGNFSIGASTLGSSDGTVNVTDNGLVNARRMNIGRFGKGTLNVIDDGSVFATQAVIGAMGKVTVADSGIFDITGTAGTLEVNGELKVNTTGSAFVSGLVEGGFPGGKLTIGPGGTLKGNGIIRANVNFAGGTANFTGSRAAPANSTGTLTIEGDVVQAAGSAMEIEIGGTAAGQFDVLKVTGDITLGGDVFLKFIDGFAPRQGNQFEFLDVSGTLAGSFANIQIRNLAPGFQFDLSRDGGDMTMVALNDGVFILPESSAWNVDASGNWSSVANWTAGDPNHAGATAVFGNKITAPRTVTVDAPVTVGRIDFENAHAYTIDGESTLTLDATSGDAQINVTGGSHTISAPVSLADNTVITVSPVAGNFSISGTLSASDVNLTKAGPGRLTLSNLQAAGLTIDAGAVAMAPGGNEASASVISSLAIAGGAAPTAKLDLANNAAIINYAGTSPAATVREQILAGRGGPGLGAAWNGQGITSSAAAAANATDAESRSVGYAENAALPLGQYTTFHGQPVDDTSLLMAFTITGDANLDGLVNDDDVTIVGATYAPGVAQASWALGDFDYNGFVDDDDVTLLGVFYDPSALPLAVSPLAAATNQVIAVPEPGTIAILVTGLIAILLPQVVRRKSR